MSSNFIRASTFLAATVLIVSLGSTSAIAEETEDVNAEASRIANEIASASDPAAALADLAPTERAIFDKWATPAAPEVTTEIEPLPVSRLPKLAGTTATTTCSSYTQRGAFYNQLGAQLGNFWTTGRACYEGTKISSTRFIDGGGRTSFLLWSYAGKSTGKGTESNVGYIYGKYNFRLTVGGVVAQSPSYCARAIISRVVSQGDYRCGIGS